METPDFLDFIIHDQVVLASAATYNAQKLDKLKLRVNVNLSRSKDWFVGTLENPVYPDVLVWQPESPTATKGKTIIVEAIETKKTIGINSATWKRLANIGAIFYLIIPKGEEVRVKQLLNTLGISPQVKIQTYYWDADQKKYLFESVT